MGTKSKGFGCTWNYPSWENTLPVIIETNLTSEIPASGIIPLQGIVFGRNCGIQVDSGSVLLCPGVYEVSYSMTVQTASDGKISTSMNYAGGLKISNAYSQTVSNSDGIPTGELVDSFLLKVSSCQDGLHNLTMVNTSETPITLRGDLHLKITRLA